KEPRKRYHSARDLADDLTRFLRGEPVRARPTPSWERGVKWARRRPATATIAALALLLAAVAAGVTFRYQANQRRERQRDAARVAVLRKETDQTLFDAQNFLARERWTDARLLLTNLRTRIRDEPRLADLHGRAGDLLGRADQGRVGQEARD